MKRMPAIPNCATVKERLNMCAVILGMIDQSRERRNDPGLASSIEHQIIERELLELELDIAADPGALECLIGRLPREGRAGSD